MREPEDIGTLLGCLIAPNSSPDKALISIDNFIVMSERNLNSSFIRFRSKQWLLEQGRGKKKPTKIIKRIFIPAFPQKKKPKRTKTTQQLHGAGQTINRKHII